MASESDRGEPAIRLEDLHPEIRIGVPAFNAGLFQEAVRKAAQRFENRIAEMSERDDLSGRALMNRAFSEQHPILVFSPQRTSLVEQDLHNGFRFLAIGVATAVRNVYTHQDNVEITASEALEWLAFISAMHRRLDHADKHTAPSADRTEELDSSAPD